MRPHLPVISTAHAKYRKRKCKCCNNSEDSASDKHLQHQKCPDISQCPKPCHHQHKGPEITMYQLHRNLEKQSVMTVDTCHIMRIRHSLIHIVNRIKVCMCVIVITLLPSSVDIRRVHTVKDQNHQCRIGKPDDPFTLFLRKRKILIQPEKDCQFSKKQKDHHCQWLCMPAIFHRYGSYLLRLPRHAHDPERKL